MDGADLTLLDLLESRQDLVLVTDRDGVILRAGAGWAAALGWDAQALVGRRCLDMVHRDDAAATRDALRALRSGRGVLRFVNRWQMRGGGWRQLDWAAVMRAGDGLICASARDATAQTRIATHAREVETISGVGSWELDLDRDTCFWSPVTRAIHGIDPDTPPPVAEALSFYPPEGRAVLEPALAALMEEGTPFDLELPFRRACGQAAWVRSTGAAERRGGQLTRVYGTFEDITARREDRARLQDFADIVELASDGIWVLDPDGRTLYANPRMAEMLGLPPGGLDGLGLGAFLDGADATLGQLAQGGSAGDLCLRRADGGTLWVSLSARPRHDRAGRLTSIVAILADITDRRAARTALEERAQATRAAKARLEATLAAMPDPVLELDAQGRICTVHASADTPLHRAARAGAGQMPHAVLGRGNAHTLRALLDRASTRGRATEAALAVVLPQGTARVDVSAAPRAMGGHVLVLRDVTRQHAQTAEIRRLGEVARLTRNPVIIADREGRIEWVNAAFEALTGWPLEEARGHTPGSLLQCPETDPDTVATIRAALRACQPVQAEILNRSRAGRLYWIRLEIQPRFDADDRHIGFTAVQTEITGLVQANRAIAEAEARAQAARDQLVAAVEALEDGFALFDAGDRLVLCNDRYRLLYADSADAIRPGARFEDILRAGLARGQYADALGREDAWLAERLAAHAASAPQVQTLACGTVLRIMEKSTRDGGRVGLRVDITELSRARDRARAAQADADRARARLDAAIDALQDGFVLFDADDRLVVANQRHRDLHPLTADAMVAGTRFEDILRRSLAGREVPAAIGREAAWLAERLAQHRTPGPAFVQRLDGGRILRIHEMPTPDGGRVGLQVDVTELFEARERAEAASAAKSAFLATMSHEIRTPLTGVLGMADILSDTPLSDAQRAMLDTLKDSGWSLLSLINDILDLARVEAGKLALDPAPFDLCALVARLEALHGATARGKGVALTVGPMPPGLRLGDETRVMQVLHNLVGNAVKFTDTGRVGVTVAAADAEGLVLRIADTGIGMSADQVARIFEAFEQAEAGTARRFGGTGLGMAIVRRLVAMMAGEVTVDSTPGRGTVVTLRLPLPEVAAQALPAQAPSGARAAENAGRLRGLRLLVAEDSATNRHLLRTILDRLQVQTRFACNGMEACAVWRGEEAFDLLLLDISMPVMDGLEALRSMTAEASAAGRPPPRAIAATANVMTEQVALYRAEGFLDVLPKPFRREELVALLLRHAPE
ncbi:MAG: PAS-domain containing protein [Alkalilacustris sp.]